MRVASRIKGLRVPLDPKQALLWKSAMKNRVIIRIMLGCVGFALALSACGEQHKDSPTAISEAQYSFDPTTIQAAIDNHRSDLFELEWMWQWNQPSPPARETRFTPSPDFVPLRWIESDFRRVVSTFTRQTVKIFVDDVEPWEIGFYTDCPYAAIGIQRMYFSFFLKRGPQDYLQWSADTDLPISRLRWYESTLSDVGDEKPPLEKGNITADIALQMAERAGGANFRTQVSNNCIVSGSIIRSDAPDLDSKWIISYKQSTVTLYEVHISPDGQVKVAVTPEP